MLNDRGSPELQTDAWFCIAVCCLEQQCMDIITCQTLDMKQDRLLILIPLLFVELFFLIANTDGSQDTDLQSIKTFLGKQDTIRFVKLML